MEVTIFRRGPRRLFPSTPRSRILASHRIPFEMSVESSAAGQKACCDNKNDDTQASELASLKAQLRAALRQFKDFPSPGILFEDILPIFRDPALHEALIRCLELHVLEAYGEKPDVVVGLDARGFLFGPSLALRLGASFAPVRKKGKLPGPVETAAFEKEYGADFFQIQADAVKPGQKVIVVDDIIATGKPITPSILSIKEYHNF